MSYPTSKWFNPTPENLAELSADTKGKRGTTEDETNLSDENWSNDHVQVCCGRGVDVSRIVERCGSKILAAKVDEHADGITVTFNVCRSAFRGVAGAFKKVDNRAAGTFPKVKP